MGFLLHTRFTGRSGYVKEWYEVSLGTRRSCAKSRLMSLFIIGLGLSADRFKMRITWCVCVWGRVQFPAPSPLSCSYSVLSINAIPSGNIFKDKFTKIWSIIWSCDIGKLLIAAWGWKKFYLHEHTRTNTRCSDWIAANVEHPILNRWKRTTNCPSWVRHY